ncbi:aldo/keto reductase [Acidipropionibacterium acidipropionici]|jgi:aryl-alcohol dehydrogenase-like predicted oxidoreductase|uniref:Alcohol dehydrogenase n=1 Tax=Acidipropionibacterium acidipropionici TaxID=1748 RepID=A0AAC8YHW1_9ACTN|nr:aldo/keto reductase [Acidipropionibacterium acidipropionici]AMS06645.1 alcohol dehydrogenase [Acidipropionibacterium acidipropionici]AOZ45431.1 alcohol dehydrogenase [Acidipropionibacterium acidipropionici]AZP38560.1 aldo/keto reductase [Acidipropionibacterium acidipropionici]QCV95504.1 aldo/keto reductase [Acidipropionibacterium acidipropionici]
MVRLSGTDLDIRPLVLGGNTFGWTSDEKESFAVLDAFTAAGGSFIDTADGYSAWAPGNHGGESETVIGHWLAARGHRDDVVIASKVATHPEFKGLAPANIAAAADASLARLGTDRIDLYYAHFDDPTQTVADMAAAFDALVRAGKIRYVGLSNFSVAREREWFDVAEREGLAKPVALQPQYNLLHRADVEGDDGYGALAAEKGLSIFSYFSLASGFLTGKYRSTENLQGAARAGMIEAYLPDDDARRSAFEVIGAERDIAAAHGVEVTSVSLAWLLARGVTAPIASARVPEQLPALLAATELTLTGSELQALDAASQGFATAA